MSSSRISAVGSYLPGKIYSNEYLETIVDTSDQWIMERTGIRERHIVSDGELTSDLALEAVRIMLEKYDCDLERIDAIVFATTTPDRTFPSCASTLQGKLAIKNNCRAFDVQAVCCGFIYAIDIADSLIASGRAKSVLVVGAETMSRIVDWKDRNTCILFGDGAGVVLLEATSGERGILATTVHSDGNYVDILKTSGGVSMDGKAGFIEMQGREVFKLAINLMYECVLQSLAKCNLTVDDIDFLVPHQANQRIIDGLRKKLNLDTSKVISTVAMHGNTSSASIPLALDYALDNSLGIEEGSLLVLESMGGGIAWGSVVIRW
jgi:3-oxoacyl-[acyl-carrier-protein] synthase-3